MKINEFLGRLESVTQVSGGWMARCPAHGDSNPSLSVSEGSDGRILVKCHAGCETQAVVEAMGLKMSDLMPERPVAAGPAAKKPKRDLGVKECEYVYQDADGAPLYRVERYRKPNGEKNFLQARLDANSRYGWTWGLHEKKTGKLLVKHMVPYHLPLVVKAAKEGKTIFVLEGEKDVDNYIKIMGCAATCNTAGALKWGKDWPENWGEWFKGARAVCVIADNDPEFKTVVKQYRGQTITKDVPHWKGQKHAADVRRKLRAAGFEGKIRLMVMPGLEAALEGHANKSGKKCVKDFTDWLTVRQAAGLAVDRAAVVAAIQGAAKWPEEWDFDDATIDSAADGDGLKGRWRDAVATAADGVGGGDEAGAIPGGGEEAAAAGQTLLNGEPVTGRFGAPVPSDPSASTKKYKVHFVVGQVPNSDTGKMETMYAEIVVDASQSLPTTIAAWQGVVGAKIKMALGKVTARVQNDIAAVVCLLWLRSRGKFFWNENDKGFATSLYFDEKDGVLTYIRSDEFMSFLATETNINRESTTFKYVMSLIDDAALSGEVSQGVVPSKLWDCKNNTIYISSGDSEMYRIGAGKVEKVVNGTDGVVFLRKQTLKPWKLVNGDGVDPFTHSLIFQGASFEDRHGAMICRLWFFNLFKVHRMKPPLLITGLFQSGKTRMAKAIKEILGMSDLSVQEAEDGDKGLDAFWATVNDGILEIYDNLDTKIKWVPNTLQVAATDGQTKRRTLYTTFGVSVLKANAHLIITSNNPRFATELGLADRLQVVRLGRTRKTSSDLALTDDIERNRDYYMTWTARTLAAALADSKPVNEVYNMRHPEFSTFSVRVSRALKCENDAIQAMKKAELDKSLLPLQDKNGIPIHILRVLVAKNGVWEFTSQQLYDAIIEDIKSRGEYDDKTSSFINTRRVGNALNDNIIPFSTLFVIEPKKKIHGFNYYRFNGFKAGIDLKVYLGHLDGDFQETPVEEQNAIDFSSSTLLNTPNTPYTPEREKEEINTDYSGGEFDGGLNDDDFIFN